MDVKRTVTYDLGDYLGMARRNWWVLIVCMVLGVGAAFAYTQTEAKVFESTTSVQVQPTALDGNPTGGRTNGTINLDTQAQLVTSLSVASEAQKLLETTTSPKDLAKQVTVSVPPNSTILNIAFDASTAQDAYKGSHSFAVAYLTFRGDQAQLAIQNQIANIQSQITPLTNTFNTTQSKIAVTPKNSPDLGTLQGIADRAQKQIEALEATLSDLQSQVQDPGSIISDATVPSKPIEPVVLINLASGVLIGLLLGLAVAIVRERTDKVLRRTADATRRFDLPVLAELPPRVKPMVNDVYPISGTAGRMFGRLRNEIVASLDEDQRVIVVSGASRGASATVVAANVACSFARSGERVVLIGANVVPGAPLSRIVDVNAAPGLLDVLSGRVPLADALQRAARCPGLGVLAVGGAASAGGLFQAEAIRSLLDELLQQADFIVIEAPSTASTSDAQTLASLADAAIITVEVRRTMHTEIADAAEQFRRVCPVVLGVVAVPRIETTKDGAVVAKQAPAAPARPMVASPDIPLVRPDSVDTAETKLLKSVDDGVGDDDAAAETKVTDTSTIVMQRIGLEVSSSADGSGR
ncbi:MAG TPA: Wzz/FepE/Etk N-terminal domain-containing protein [Micromonosporaceae bacterium]|nr:Wzz/FepE/Etk N-terminal domain-containing protein [Micromonosporaceae bacterium]